MGRRKLSETEKRERQEAKKRLMNHRLEVIRKAEKERQQMEKKKQKRIKKINQYLRWIEHKLFTKSVKHSKIYLSKRKYASQHMYGTVEESKGVKNPKLKNYVIPKRSCNTL